MPDVSNIWYKSTIENVMEGKCNHRALAAVSWSFFFGSIFPTASSAF
jgi:hypothetical protein